ncbi:ATP-binding cassette sub-family C member 4-like [Convolutriloba macropyga]|uniref:ATP-binding cassette sub-family C member 4-like n=1 Tax=Convolutriloba macropyga TaxID=536237 RepID=UPI003F529093
MPDGDQTVVGERGVMLSGGQKARISLARAAYRDADIVLLDDPLSAVDTHVSKQLFEKCISGLLKDKIVILATHQLQYLHQATKVLLFQQGTMLASGTADELVSQGYDVGDIVRTVNEDDIMTSQGQRSVLPPTVDVEDNISISRHSFVTSEVS